MISDNHAVNKQEILNKFKDRLKEIANTSSRYINSYLNREEFDTLEKNGERVSYAPMHMRDDVNFSDHKILEKFNIVVDKQYIQLEDIIELCKEVYLYIIRMGFIDYTRWYTENDYNRRRNERSSAVLFNHDFIYANSETYRRLFGEKDHMNLPSLLNQPVTDTSILYEFLNNAIQYALSKEAVRYEISVQDCHSDCHTNNPCHCHGDRDDDCHSNCHRIGADKCNYVSPHDDACFCWSGRGTDMSGW